MVALSGAEQQLVPRIVGIARLARVRPALQQQLHDFRVARAHGLVNGKLIPMLSIDQSPVFREERLHFRQVAERAGLEERPGVVTVQLLDAINVSPRLHFLWLRESVGHSQNRPAAELARAGPGLGGNGFIFGGILRRYLPFNNSFLIFSGRLELASHARAASGSSLSHSVAIVRVILLRTPSPVMVCAHSRAVDGA